MNNISEQNELSIKVETSLINYIKKKERREVTMREIKATRSYEEFMCFLGCIKNFKTLKRSYVREFDGVLTVFSI